MSNQSNGKTQGGFVETEQTSVQSWLVWLVPLGVCRGSVGLGGLGMLAANELAIAGKVGCGLDDGDDEGGGGATRCVPSRLGLSFRIWKQYFPSSLKLE